MSSDVPDWLSAAREHWVNRGVVRPAFAVVPGPGQESVWDYPRPPAIVADRRLVEVFAGAVRLASTSLCQVGSAVRVLETSHPPSFYMPPEALEPNVLVAAAGRSHCEWKGEAEYLATAGSTTPVGWRYPRPYPDFAEFAGWVSFYPGRVRCVVDGIVASAQAGGFYGGWITPDVVGPFKGEPGTAAW
jgi:uncharacterized protein (DUF427 family)